MNIAIIICAAGSSTRFSEGLGPLEGDARSKLDEDLGGRPVLQRAVELFTKRDEVGRVIVAGPFEDEAFAQFSFRHADRLTMLGASLCRGGKAHRYESVKAALGHVPEEATHVAVHDAARPVTDQALLDRLFDAAERHPAVIPGVPVADTLKRVAPDPIEDASSDPLAGILGAGKAPSLHEVVETADRSSLYAVQTPQVFEAGLFKRAYAQPDLTSTDDASLVEKLGERVLIVEGDPTNIKITRPKDVRLARLIGGFDGPRDRPSHKRF